MRRWPAKARAWLSVRYARISKRAEAAALFLGILFAALTGAHSGNFPDDQDWGRGQPLAIAQILVGVGLVSAQALAYLSNRGRRRRQRLENACRTVAAHIDRTTPIPLAQVGVQIWQVRGGGLVPHLRRAAKFLLISDRPRSGIRWRKGKGVVGVAWEKRAALAINLDALQRKARSAAGWAALSDEERLGMEREEILNTGQYKAVYARPLYSRIETSADPEVVGVLAIDVIAPNHIQQLRGATIHNVDFASVVGLCESALLDSDE